MSETQEQEVTKTEAPPPETQETQAAETQETTEEKKGNGKAGEEFIDFKTAAPEEVEKRFRRIYGHMKQSERVNAELIANQRALVEKLEKVEQNVSDGAKNDVLATLKSEKKAALESGDFDKVIEIDDRIIELKTAVEKKPESKSQPEGPLNREQLSRVQEWIREVNSDGDYIRPWAQPGHPLNAKVANLAAAAMEDPELSAQGMEAVLSEVDKLMSKPKPVRTTAVLSGDGDIRPPSGKKTTLSADERYVAAKMFPDLPPDKAESRYSEARKKWSK